MKKVSRQQEIAIHVQTRGWPTQLTGIKFNDLTGIFNFVADQHFQFCSNHTCNIINLICNCNIIYFFNHEDSFGKTSHIKIITNVHSDVLCDSTL